jgi:hypothetical protein
MKKNISKALASGLVCVFTMSTGCMNLPKDWALHDVRLNTELTNRDAFKDVDDFDARVSKLYKGMPSSEIYETLGVEKGRFNQIPREERMKYLSGSTPAPQTREAVAHNIDLTDRTRVATFQFKQVDERGALKGAATAVSATSGFDLRILLIVQDDVLYDFQASGTARVNGQSMHYIWEMLGTGVKGIAFGGAAVGGAQLLK